MKKLFIPLLSITFVTALLAEEPKQLSAATAADAYLKNPAQGALKLNGAGALHAGPLGLLLVAEQGGTIVAIDTGDRGAAKPLKGSIADLNEKIAGALGAKPGTVRVNDMAANPQTATIYLSVSRNDGLSTLLTINGDGQIAALNTAKTKWVRVKLSDTLQISTIADLSLAPGRLLAAGQSNDAFRSKIFSVPLPLTDGAVGHVYSTDTYHVAHGQWETRAPIQSFILLEEAGDPYLVGAFACTPIAKFPLNNLKNGAQIKGTSVLELGSGNRPMDMFTYESGGKNWLVTTTQRFQQPFAYTPSKYWAVRIDMKHIATSEEDKTNKNALKRDRAIAKDPQGIEVVESLHGALQVDKYGPKTAVALRETAGKLSLDIVELP